MTHDSTPSVLVFPYSIENSFTDMLYAAVRATGYRILGATTFDEFGKLARDLQAGDVVHVQWTAPVWRGSRTQQDAWLRLHQFQSLLGGAQSRGVAVVWTVHNLIDHDTRFAEQSAAIARFLAERAAAIHVLNRGTSDAVAGSYALPSHKVVVIPHSSYLGIYPSDATRESARQAFGIGPDDRAVLFFGQMRPYKGLTTLFDAIADRRSDRSMVLMLAGATHPDELAGIEAALPNNVRVIREHNRIADADVQLWFRAADVTALPYRSVLNSGTVLLSATFGVPIILPDLRHLRLEFAGERWVHFFDGTSEGLRAQLERIGPNARESRAAVDFARRLSPWSMSVAFRAVIERVRTEVLETSAAGLAQPR